MNTKKILVGSLVAGGVLALIRLAFDRVASSEPAPHSLSYAAIDAFVEEQRRRLHIPGVALAVVESEEITHVQGFGQACPGGEPPTPQTPFCIGSLTKSFTALAVMQLVEAGKVELDAPVQRYLPWFRVAPLQASAKITVRHLLNQTSGLSVASGWIPLADPDNRPDACERQARALSSHKLTRPVGSAFEYSNMNFNLLGLIIEAVSGETYADYVQHHIFDPLRMSQSYTLKGPAQQAGMAVGHQSWFGIPVAVPDLPMASGSLPSGQLISSAEDMARYLIAHLNGGRCGDAQILSPEGMAELHRPAVETKMLDNGIGWYGMGWYIEERSQTRIVMHSGLVPDFYAFMALLPDQKKGVVMLVNIDHFTMQLSMADVDEGLSMLLAGQQPAPNRLGFMFWATRFFLLIPLLQIIDVVATLRRLRRWGQNPPQHPNRGRLWGLHILAPLVPNLSLIAIPVWLVVSRLFGFMRLFAPDFTWLTLISGGFAGIWTILRTRLILGVPKKNS